MKQYFAVRPGTIGLEKLAIKLFGSNYIGDGYDGDFSLIVYCGEEDIRTFVDLADMEFDGNMKHSYIRKSKFEIP